MAKARRKKVATKPFLKPPIASHNGVDAVKQFQDQIAFNHQEVERRIAAIQAIQAAEVHLILGRLRVLRSYFSMEQLQTPALKFFEENLPNLQVVKDEESKIFELRQVEKNCAGNDRFSLANPVDNLHFSVESAKHSFLDAASLSIPYFGLDAKLDTQIFQKLGTGDAFQTPVGRSDQLSFGMKPKTSRLPKQGEMLLSVHGSPLGVFNEDHLEAIHESGDCYNAASFG